MRNVYLDNNATTQVAPEVTEAMLPFFNELWGNPSSMHYFGGQVAQHIEAARANVASLLEIDDLQVHYPGESGPVRAVDGLTLAIDKGETYALVGESGCGKSATALALLRLVEPGRIVAGRLLFEGADLLQLTEKQMRGVRGRRIGIVF